MAYTIKKTCENIDWHIVCQIKKEAGLATHSLEQTKKAFSNSYVTVFIYDQEQMIGIGRAISDGVYQAAIYDIAVLPAWQGKRIGQLIISEIHKEIEGFTTILYASPGKEGFYEKLGYAKMCTGMARFPYPDLMRERGFIK